LSPWLTTGADVEYADEEAVPRLGIGADVEDAGEEDAGSKASWRIGVPSAA
jgi:hypothetical protein